MNQKFNSSVMEDNFIGGGHGGHLSYYKRVSRRMRWDIEILREALRIEREINTELSSYNKNLLCYIGAMKYLYRRNSPFYVEISDIILSYLH